MALNKIAAAKVGNFGSLTTTGHSKADKSIFGQNACNTVCSYENSFNDFTASNKSALDIFSTEGKANLDKTIRIMTCTDKPQPSSKKFEMNMNSFAVLQKELGLNEDRKKVSLCS